MRTNEECAAYFARAILRWIEYPRITARFTSFGYSKTELKPFLDAYVKQATDGWFTSSEEIFKRYQISRFADCAAASDKTHIRLAEAEVTFSNIFFSWLANREDSRMLDELVLKGNGKQSILQSLRNLAEVSIRRPAEEFPWARKLRRKIIMHVGPTNSGKTHHALRALAAARTGIYAGPLRLLAHEIWERLNLGQIAPLGVETEQPKPISSSSDTKVTTTTVNPTTPDASIAPQAAKLNSNPAYARVTNMLTGEEKKIVDEHAPLLSCTVEMIPLRTLYDVGVIDEIQMIGDSQRGFAWTTALLGLCAHEIHLCGEESAIPVVRELLKDTGDTLVIRKYERLSPLSMEEQSLNGDYSKVQKGDCVVAFSRSRIFGIKEDIEKKSGLRCAVVYGKLPPEVRSEQAALFNDTDSGFDVIIGSDAIGMGLNLYVFFFSLSTLPLYMFLIQTSFRKIRRIIFDQINKSDGQGHLIPLSISQIKQIAGRAGRYGHSLSGDKPGGFVTTLHEQDLPTLKEALEYPATPTLTNAYISSTNESFIAIASALPSTPSAISPPNFPSRHQERTLEIALMAHIYAALPPSRVYKYTQTTRIKDICSWIEQRTSGVLTWEEKLQLLNSPVAWRDPGVVQALEEMVKMQTKENSVRMGKFLSMRSGFIKALEAAERRMTWSKALVKAEAEVVQAQERGDDSVKDKKRKVEWLRRKEGEGSNIGHELLEQLEALHKILVVYMWMHFRNIVVYPDRVQTEGLKHRVEVVLDWGLQELGRRSREESRFLKHIQRKRLSAEIDEEQQEVVQEQHEKGRVIRAIRETQQGYTREREGDAVSPRRKAKLPFTIDELDYEFHEDEPPTPTRPDAAYPAPSRHRSGVEYTKSMSKSGGQGHWDNVPDMTTMLRKYVNDSRLKANARR
jgi:ATP-dependent RNA helicase SUPV3L1/SUV3